MRKGDIGVMMLGTAMGALLHSGILNAGEISNNVFTVKESKVLSVSEDNKTLIEKDDINYFASLNIAEDLTTARNEKTSVVNLIHKNDKNLQFRREVALHQDGHLELTMKMRFFPFTDNSAPKSVSYSFLIPLETLDGMKFKAAVGRASEWKWEEGSINSKMPDGVISSQCRYMILQNETKGYTLDFNPNGPGGSVKWSMYGQAAGYWEVAKKGKYLKCSLNNVFKYYGGLFSGKMLIYKGICDFAQKHALTHWDLISIDAKDIKTYQFMFGAKAKKKGFTSADREVYSPERKWGWKDSKNLKILKTDNPDIINNCVFSPDGREDEFVVDIDPGIYLLSIRCGHNIQKIGPFNISLNGRTAHENLEIPPGKTETVNVAEYVRAPETKLRIGFSGKNIWSVRSIIIQTLIYQNEDYRIDRDFWVMNKLFSPDIE